MNLICVIWINNWKNGGSFLTNCPQFLVWPLVSSYRPVFPHFALTSTKLQRFLISLWFRTMGHLKQDLCNSEFLVLLSMAELLDEWNMATTPFLFSSQGPQCSAGSSQFSKVLSITSEKIRAIALMNGR